MVVLVICLFVSLLCALLYLHGLKKDIRRFKTMLEKISQIDTNMRLTTITFDKDVSHLADIVNTLLDKQKQVELEKEQTNRAFRQGITNISHDLRTPLTSAKGYLGLIKTATGNQQKIDAYLEIVEGRLESLTHLMNQLFEYTQIIEEKTVVKFETIDICALIKEELASFYDAFTTEGFIVKTQIPGIAVNLVADEVLFKRVVQNLLNNVVKHGISEVAVALNSEGVVTISNKITNVDELDTSRLFERFYTSDASRHDQKTGLGLAISKELMRLMGGEISASLQEDYLCMTIRIKN